IARYFDQAGQPNARGRQMIADLAATGRYIYMYSMSNNSRGEPGRQVLEDRAKSFLKGLPVNDARRVVGGAALTNPQIDALTRVQIWDIIGDLDDANADDWPMVRRLREAEMPPPPPPPHRPAVVLWDHHGGFLLIRGPGHAALGAPLTAAA